MTNRENITNENVTDLLVRMNKNIPYKCVIECIDPAFSAGACYNYDVCLKCINDWLNSEVRNKNE